MSYLSEEQLAELIITRIKEHSTMSGRVLNRLRITRATLSRLSGRVCLPDAFIRETERALLDRGWVMFQNSASGFGLIEAGMTTSWTTCTLRGELSSASLEDDS